MEALKTKIPSRVLNPAYPIDPQYYIAQYKLCKSEHRAEKRMRDIVMQMNKSTYARDDSSGGNFSSNRGTRSFTPRFCGGLSSFFQAGSRWPSFPLCCILCGETGHPVSEHYNSHVTVICVQVRWMRVYLLDAVRGLGV